ncbi:MAG: hypothetical protein K0R59_1623 [Sphingobacterium sp.]|jgi:carboxyl-terminal processing protease|nr:hypothetical protein [Sphingobacterium sp.]
MIKTPKAKWGTKVLLLLSLSMGRMAVGASENLPRTEKQQLILKTTMFYIGQKHVQPPVMNDDFSQIVWNKYFDFIDQKHKIFLQKDIAVLEKYQNRLDDEIQENTFDFFDRSDAVYRERMIALRGICNEILAKPFAFTKTETFKEQDTYPASVAEQRERWRKSLKYTVLKKFNLLKEKKSGKTDDLLEKESRMAVKKWINAYFERMLKPETTDINFSYYINAILFEIDPHTIYNMPAQSKQKQESFSKRFFGVGISMKEIDGEYFVEEIVPGGEAANSGLLQIGDQILQIGNLNGQMQEVFALPADEVVAMIRGDKDTQVQLRIKNNKGEKSINLKRTEIKDAARLARSAMFVKGSEKIGIVHLPDFYEDVNDPNGAHASIDVIREIDRLNQAGMTSLIIDLRNNPGGSLSEVVRLAGALIGNGPKVQIKGRTGVQVMQTDFAPIFKGPIAVMINQYSASASEIFAAVMQDYKRGLVIGGPTSYGKGTAQEVWPIGKMADERKGIPAISLGSINLTTYMFYRVNGQATQRIGVQPDILLPSANTYTAELERDYGSALPNVPIPTAQYQLSNSVTEEQIMDWKRHLQYAAHFGKIDSLAKLITEKNKAALALDLSTYKKQLAIQERWNKELKNLIQLSDWQQHTLQSQGEASTVTEKWYMDWLENSQKDIYIAQTRVLLEQMKDTISVPPATYTLKLKEQQ